MSRIDLAAALAEVSLLEDEKAALTARVDELIRERDAATEASRRAHDEISNLHDVIEAEPDRRADLVEASGKLVNAVLDQRDYLVLTLTTISAYKGEDPSIPTKLAATVAREFQPVTVQG